MLEFIEEIIDGLQLDQGGHIQLDILGQAGCEVCRQSSEVEGRADQGLDLGLFGQNDGITIGPEFCQECVELTEEIRP